jgi:hypothetical protein
MVIDHMRNNVKSTNPDYKSFKGRKHDQSVLSLLVKKRLPMLNDYLLDHKEVSQEKVDENSYKNSIFPFVASRINDVSLTTVIDDIDDTFRSIKKITPFL